ncbi:MAG TPA: DUF1189 family protein [Candidatus Eisenbacteria bacterium]|nr:DUF1189 family protein [Candidatus Eisenbacteria bacterium]
MRRYSIFQAIPLSFFSRDLYRDVATAWRGAGIVYMVVLVAILAVLVLAWMGVSINRWVHDSTRELTAQIPTLVIRHRVVEVGKPMPYVIRSEKGAELVIVDTTGAITSLDDRQATLLVTADRILYRKSSAETRVFNLSGVKDLRIDSERAKRWLGLFAAWAAPVATPFVFAGMFAFRMVQLVAFALVAMMTAALTRIRLDFAALMRLTAVALTPALLLEGLLDLAHVKPGGWGFLWTLITLGYVVWAVLANRPAPGTPAAEVPAGPPAA